MNFRNRILWEWERLLTTSSSVVVDGLFEGRDIFEGAQEEHNGILLVLDWGYV